MAVWDDRTARDFSAIRSASHRDLEILELQVDQGEALLHAVEVGGVRVGSMIWSIETETDGKRALIVQAIGCDAVPGRDLLSEVHAAVEVLAKFSKCWAIRCWTERPGMVRKLGRVGFRSRYVLEKEIA